MTRREYLGTAEMLTAGLPSLRAQSAARPKNVLLLMSDQHRRDFLGVAGNRLARTPNLDALARFGAAYCSNPVCTPSRASLLTGLYTHNHQAWNNATPWPFEHKTVAHYFGRAGYMTALIGKIHFVDAQTHGFDYHLDFNDWYQYLGPKTKLYADELGRANSGSGMPQIDDLWRDEGDPWKGVRTVDARRGPVAVGRASEIPEQDHLESFVARETSVSLKRTASASPSLPSVPASNRTIPSCPPGASPRCTAPRTCSCRQRGARWTSPRFPRRCATPSRAIGIEGRLGMDPVMPIPGAVHSRGMPDDVAVASFSIDAMKKQF